MNATPVQLVFQALRVSYRKLGESQIAYLGEEGPPFPNRKELIKAQLVVELIDRYQYSPQNIRVDALIALKGHDFRYVEADVLLETSHGKPLFVFAVEVPELYRKSQKENIQKLFSIAESFHKDLRPEYLVYYTRWYTKKRLNRRFCSIDLRQYQNFSAWRQAGSPMANFILPSHGQEKASDGRRIGD